MSPTINEQFEENFEFIQDCYTNNITKDNSNYFSLITSPFKVLKLKKVLPNSYMNDLKKAIESLVLVTKNNDLYSLCQSEDLNNCQLKPVKKFIHILEKEIGPFLSKICNVKLNEKISITASLYKQNDVLLCHDDKCEDRCIAFVYYLTGSDNCGGSFDMFAHDDNHEPTDVVCKLPPEENTFICFEVGNLTYHQVSEVIDEKFERWSINGWFHSDRKLPILDYEEPLPPMHKQNIVEGLVMNKIFSEVYCSSPTLAQMQEYFENESFLHIKDVFLTDFFESCTEELFNNTLLWKKRGPANRRNYLFAELNNLPEALNSLIELLYSPTFIGYLKKITNLSLEPFQDENNPGSEFALELIKWSPGSYTMATDNDGFFKKPGLDLFVFFGIKKCTNKSTSGYITYLDTADEEDAEEMEYEDEQLDKEILTIVPDDNVMSLVYRTEHTVSFTKYINHSFKGEYYAIYATYYEVDEDTST